MREERVNERGKEEGGYVSARQKRRGFDGGTEEGMEGGGE